MTALSYEDINEIYLELDGERELILTYCTEEELESGLSWDKLLEIAQERDEEAANQLEEDYSELEIAIEDEEDFEDDYDEELEE